MTALARSFEDLPLFTHAFKLFRKADLPDERWVLTSHSRRVVLALVALLPSQHASGHKGAQGGLTEGLSAPTV